MRKKFIKMPTHIAFIMDGNRRWATKRGLDKMLGHRQGAIAMKNLVEVLADLKDIKYASFFAFSTENWNRDKKEIDYIFDLVYNLIDQIQDFDDKNIKIVIMGDLSRFPEKLKNKAIWAVDKTKNNTGLVVNIAINYGGRDDIVRSANLASKRGEITIETLSENLYSYPSPDIDLVVRTSGEMRISNFMLFQMAYSELYFTKTYWPDFDKKQLFKALKEFSKRNRRYGGN